MNLSVLFIVLVLVSYAGGELFSKFSSCTLPILFKIFFFFFLTVFRNLAIQQALLRHSILITRIKINLKTALFGRGDLFIFLFVYFTKRFLVSTIQDVIKFYTPVWLNLSSLFLFKRVPQFLIYLQQTFLKVFLRRNLMF